MKYPLVLATIGLVVFISMGCGSSGEVKQSLATTPGDGVTLQNSSPNLGRDDHPQSLGQVELTQIHGMGFSTDGRRLIVAARGGLHIFVNDKWQTPNLPGHDYMSYIATNDGFYGSGQPNPSADLIDPFGLIKSSDEGKTLTKLGFEGQSTFHLMGVGYQNHTIYVLNSKPNPKLPQAGIYYSLDNGQTWKQSALKGMTADPIQIAVHPIKANIVVMATENGLFLSQDYGATFKQIAESGPASAAVFTSSGDALIFGYQGLFAYDLANEKVLELSAPALFSGDAIGYIAVSPVRIEHIAVATFQRDLFLSMNGGFSWQQIAQAGIGVTLN